MAETLVDGETLGDLFGVERLKVEIIFLLGVLALSYREGVKLCASF